MTAPATEAAPQVATPPPAPAPAPEAKAAAIPAPPKAAERPSPEAVLASFDAEFEALVAKTKPEIAGEKPSTQAKKEPAPQPAEKGEEAQVEAAAEGEAEAEALPEQPDGEWEEGIVPPSPEEALPNKHRAALKAIKDPEIRREFARAHFLVKGYERAGMRLSDISKYIAAAPTPEILGERVQRAEQLDAFVEEFTSAQPDNIYRVAEVLRQTSPKGWVSLVDAVIDNIHVVRPEKIRPLGDKILRAVITNMRNKAEEDGNLVLADHADGIEEYLGLGAGAAKQKGGREETRIDPELQQRLAEADEIKRREKQRESEQFAASYKAFNDNIVSEATREGVSYVKDWIEENCASYSNEAKAELFDRMTESVLTHVRSNAHVAKTLQRLIDDGSGDEAHRKRCADYLVRTSRSVFVTVAPQVLSRFQKVFGQAAARRADKVARARTSRDIGSTGSPAVAHEAKLSGKGKDINDVLKEFDALG